VKSRPTRNVHWQFVLLVTLSIWGFVFEGISDSPKLSQDDSRESIEKLKDLMPKGFKEVYLGMSRKLLLEVRSVKPMTVTESQSAKLWLENELESPFYNKVIYGFAGNSDELDWVAFLMESSGKHIQRYSPYLLKGSIIKWGDDYKIVINKMKHSKRSYHGATLVWQKEIATIAVSYTPKHSAGEKEKSAFLVRIMRPTLELDKVIGIEKNPREADFEAIRKDLKELEHINPSDVPYFE